MKPPVWRAFALCCIAAAIAFIGFQLTLPDRDDFGLQFIVNAKSPGVLHIKNVVPNSAAAKAGVRKGDSIFYGNTTQERAAAMYAQPATTVRFIVNGKPVYLKTAPAQRVHIPWVVTAVRLAFLFIAAFLAWRRPDDRAARALVAFLGCYGLAIAMSAGLLPWAMLSFFVFQICSLGLFLMGTAAAALFAARFPAGATKRVPAALARIAMTLAVMVFLFQASIQWFVNSTAQAALISALVLGVSVLIGLLVISTFAVAYVQGGSAERQRRRWVFFMLALGLCGPIADITVTTLAGYNALLDELTLIPLGIVPFGLAYVILRHRVIDVGFVLNRALVYTGVSVFIVGVFVIVETVLAKYVESTSHVESTAVQLAVALILGFSVRYIHARVDRFVDTVLFRERHEAETAMRTFAHDAAYITDADTLIEMALATVHRHAGSSSEGIWLRDDAGRYELRAGTLPAIAIDENDRAALAMRSRRVAVDLHDSQSAVPGSMAFPMIVRGELTGMLVCGPKPDDETYAPDERETLAAIASSVGQALDGLRITELERTVERLLQGAAATQGAMGTF